MAVTKCVCFNKPFAGLLDLCRHRQWTTVAEISQHTGCGTGCGGCRPYLVQMLKTGCTSYRVRQGDHPPEPAEPEPWERGS